LLTQFFGKKPLRATVRRGRGFEGLRGEEPRSQTWCGKYMKLDSLCFDILSQPLVVVSSTVGDPVFINL